MKSSEENEDSDPENPSASEGDNKKRNSVLKATMRKMRSYYKNKSIFYYLKIFIIIFFL